MTARGPTMVVLGTALWLAAEHVASAETKRFALVVGNNRPDSKGVATLRYADDDAIATHELLLDAGVHSVVLARPDSDTRRLHRGLAPAGLPAWPDLNRALDDLSARIAVARSRGEQTEFYFFYSGHGDVANGQGYVALEDKRLTRTLFFEHVLRRPAADRNHVFIDACKSYFLAFEKGKGSSRRLATPGFSLAPGDAIANTGFVLSTNADRDSHEWERFQAGIFSHELRSALRGAADANLDDAITYRELEAFLHTANEAVDNPAYRPAFTVVAPSREPQSTTLRWPAEGPVVVADRPGLGHLYLETASGRRLLDWHAADGQRLRLHVAGTERLFARSGDESVEFALPTPLTDTVRFSSLTADEPQVLRRGALHLAFETLFAVPFGRDAITRLDAQRPEHEVAPAMDLRSRAATAKEPRTTTSIRRIVGYTAISAAALGLGSHLWALHVAQVDPQTSQRKRVEKEERARQWATGAAIAYGVAAASTATWLILRLRSEDYDDSGFSVGPKGSGVAVSWEGAW